MGERYNGIVEVGGSIPPSSTISKVLPDAVVLDAKAGLAYLAPLLMQV